MKEIQNKKKKVKLLGIKNLLIVVDYDNDDDDDDDDDSIVMFLSDSFYLLL
jgi:hypothetical protein